MISSCYNLSLIIVTLLLMISIVEPVLAVNITGRVTTGSTGLADAKVTAERVGEYRWTRTTSSGTSVGSYTLTVDSTNQYTVSSSKTGYIYTTKTVNGGGTADFSLSSRPLTQVVFKIAYDPTEGSRMTIDMARYYLYEAERWFREEHGIDFTDYGGPGTVWDTNGLGSSNSCEKGSNSYLNDLRRDANWYSGSYGTNDILIGFTWRTMSERAYGCINTIPSSGGTHPYIAISTISPDIVRTVMHEISHAYGLYHNTSPCSGQIPNIMADHCPSTIYIKNWAPADDLMIESRRGWY